MEQERRQHRRLSIRLPLDCYEGNQRANGLSRAVTRDISPGGLAFEVELAPDAEPPAIHSLLTLELVVPPGDGHFPYEGHVRSLAEVTRCDVLQTALSDPNLPRKLEVAARFREPIKLLF